LSAGLERARELLQSARAIVVLTGAGVSAESGVPTFRGAGGLWRSHRPEQLATAEAFARDPRLVWEWYAWRRSVVRACAPNPAHLALARLALERGQWADAARLTLEPAPGAYPWHKYPQAEAINAFARGVGAGLSGDAAGAGVEAARLKALRAVAAERKIDYWAQQIDIQAEVVRGVAECAAGGRDTCVTILRVAADREDATEKHGSLVHRGDCEQEWGTETDQEEAA